jgi:3',5'-cyclic AMP phosphodiesterase CpdA
LRKILAITDIHLRSAGRDIIGLSPLKQFKNALEHAAQTHPDAEYMVLMGDLTNSGHPEEFEMVKEAIEAYPIPITFMLGNHDRRDNFVSIFPNIALTKSGHLQTRIDLGDDVLLCLDTLDGPPYPKYHHTGLLCSERLNWLADQLATCAGKRVSLFMHHPPHDIGFPGMDCIKLKNSVDLFAITAQHPNIRHIFAGHVHRTISGHTNGVGFSMFKSTCHQMPMAMDSNDPSLSVAEPAAYGIILFNSDSIIAHTEDYDIAVKASAPSADAMPD